MKNPHNLIIKYSLILMVLFISIFHIAAQPQNECWKTTAAGRYHGLAINNDGSLHGWGRNFFGQLGDGSGIERTTTVQVGNATNWEQISGGRFHSLALQQNGTLWAWGLNTSGQLGIGNTNNTNIPTQIGSNTNWISIDAGSSSNFAIAQSGTLWAWGDNSFGQLGTGNNTQNNSPVQIGTDTDWKMVCGGEGGHTVALKQNGTLWAWGWNNYGQLGIGNNTNTNAPTQVGTTNNWKTVSVGYQQTLAIKTDGTLWTWGMNSEGQLGDGSLTNKNSPVQIGTATNWFSVSAGVQHSTAIQLNGSIWTWGLNVDGQLGNGSLTNANTPTQMTWTTNWELVSANGSFTLALLNNNTIMAWGENAHGQLGDGSHHYRNYPLSIGSKCCSSIIPASLSNGLLASYTFAEGHITDFSGNNNHLTNTTTASPVPDRNGNAFCAFQFNKSNNEFLNLNTPTFINGITTAAFSVSLWYNATGSRPINDYELLLGRDVGLHCPDTYGQWSIGLYDCRRAVAGINQYSVWQGSGIPCDSFLQATSNQWHHLTFVYTGSAYQIYIDGTLYSSANGPCGNLPTNAGDLLLGKDFTGYLDDVFIFNRALVANEVLQLKDMGSLCCYETLNLVKTETFNKNSCLSIYPNPVSSELHISGIVSSPNYQIFDMSGVLLKQGIIGSNNSINVNNFDTGIYIVVIDGIALKFIK